MIDVDSLTEAEQRLINAVRAGYQCDFSERKEIQPDDMADWGAERTIRAAVLRSLVTRDRSQWDLGPNSAEEVSVRGAVVCDDLTGFDEVNLSLRLSCCRVDGEASLERTNFDGSASFEGTTFAGSVRFDGTKFRGRASFDSANFAGDASFVGVTFAAGSSFQDTTFEGDAAFSHTTFGDDTSFNIATFRCDADFSDATFTDEALFYTAIFSGQTEFLRATFNSDVSFPRTIFIDDVSFDDVNFGGDTWFWSTYFTGTASFQRATFTGRAGFVAALARYWDFERATFMVSDCGPWVGFTVSLRHAVLTAGARVEIIALEIDMRSVQAREGIHLVLHTNGIDLSDSEFLRRSIIAGAAQGYWAPGDWVPAQVKQLRETFAQKLSAIPPRCKLISLERSTTGELVLSNVILDDCTFAGAHGLDKMRIGADCRFRRTRDPSSADVFTRRRMVTRRRIIAEEIAWRNANTGRKKRRKPTESSMLACDIAGIYRDLRKGLEDLKNEPEAADFYYGEMEMRRLAGRARGDDSKANHPAPLPMPLRPALARGHVLLERVPGRSLSLQTTSGSVMERILLYGYWAVSGYGLRAWRAVTMLLVLVVGTALLFSHLALAIQTPPERIASINPTNGAVTYVNGSSAAPGFWTALNFSARESVSLLHADSTLKTHGTGTVLDFVLRLAGPVLLAFIVLALRARTKR